jgi:hypothetical protein
LKGPTSSLYHNILILSVCLTLFIFGPSIWYKFENSIIRTSMTWWIIRKIFYRKVISGKWPKKGYAINAFLWKNVVLNSVFRGRSPVYIWCSLALIWFNYIFFPFFERFSFEGYLWEYKELIWIPWEHSLRANNWLSVRSITQRCFSQIHTRGVHWAQNAGPSPPDFLDLVSNPPEPESQKVGPTRPARKVTNNRL